MASKIKFGECELCRRNTHLTFHHLIPKKLHRRKHFKKHYEKSTLNKGITICRRCHSGLHKLFDEMTLGKELHTLTLLQENADVMRHCEWVAKQKLCNSQTK